MQQEDRTLTKSKLHLKWSGFILGAAIIFSLGYISAGQNAQATSFANKGTFTSGTLDQVKSIIDDKFISWNASSSLPTDKELEYGVIQGFVNAYKDPYTIYFPPKEAKSFQDTVKGSFGGIGAQVGMKDGMITIIAPLKDSPAMKAGIKSGDVVVQVDSADVTGQNVDEVVGKIRGEIGTSVTIGVIHKGESTIVQIKITRDTIKMPTVDTRMEKGSVFVISLYNFNAESSELFRKALDQYIATSSSRLVIDLRGNPGGYLDAAVNISSFFVPEGKAIVSEKSRDESISKDHRSRGFNYLARKPDTRIAVLVDGGSASAAEIVAGSLKDHNIATLIGEKTFGKGSVQELVELADGSSLKVTVAKWYTPNGVNISLHGIEPNIKVTASTSTASTTNLKVTATSTDITMAKALEFLK